MNNLEDLEALSGALLAVTERTETREVLQMIVESARTLVGAEYAALGVPDEDGRFSDFYAAGISAEQWQKIGPMPRVHGILAKMTADAKPHRLDDVRRDPGFSGWPSAHPQLAGFLGVPIIDRGAVLGSVWVANSAGGATFGTDDERRMGILAAHAAIALTRARMFERDRELTLIEERSRIARELHDAVAQKLFSVRLTAGAAETLAQKGDAERSREALGRVKELAGSALDELRAVVSELRPPAVREDGLLAALKKHVAVIDRAYPASIELEIDSECDGRCSLPDEVEDAVFRIAQEALHNALRHAEPTTVSLYIGTPPGKVILTVADNGSGFEDVPATKGGHHLGLQSMRERARSAGGRVRVKSRPGAGTTVSLEVPYGDD